MMAALDQLLTALLVAFGIGILSSVVAFWAVLLLGN